MITTTPLSDDELFEILGIVPDYNFTLVYGHAGSGKSWFARTYRKPMLVIGCDPYHKMRPYMSSEFGAKHAEPESASFYRNFPAITSGGTIPAPIHVTDVGEYTEYHGVPQPVVRIEHYLDEDPNLGIAGQQLIARLPLLKDRQWATIVLDSLTYFQEAIVRNKATHRVSPGKNRENYKSRGDAKTVLEDTLMCRLASFRETDIVIVGHLAKDPVDQAEGQVKGLLSISDFGTKLRSAASEVYYAHKIPEEGGSRHTLLTDGNDEYVAQTSIEQKPPQECEPTWEALWQRKEEGVV